MFREFFCSSCRSAAVAWAGLLVVVGYAFFLASVKARLNDFYSTFYDLLQKGGDVDPPSGEYEDTYADYRNQVTSELYKFAMIVMPLVSATPACKYARSAWAFLWRTALMRAYLEAWDTQREPIEGASQRLHEDTQRFASGLEGCLITVLDAVFTLIVFTPILLDLSREVAPPLAMGTLRDSWLFGMAFTCSIVGPHRRRPPRPKAREPRDLQPKGRGPAAQGSGPARDHARRHRRHAALERRPLRRLPAPTYFRNTLESLHKNYFALFKHFGVLNCWLSFFDQVMVLAPYAIAAPLVFAADPNNRITLGTLIKMSNSFEKVFASLSVIAENWGAINDFRSTYRRLREFEQKLYPPVTTFGWRRPRVGTGVSRSNSGTATTQLTEVRPRGETVHEVLGEPVPPDERSENYDRSAGAAPTQTSNGRPPPEYEMRV